MHGMYSSQIPLIVSPPAKQNVSFGRKHFIVGYPHANNSATTDKQEEQLNNQLVPRPKITSKIENSSYLIDNNRVAQPFFTSIHNIPSILATLISQAKKSILIAAFALTDPIIVQQLKKAHKTGIKVEVITDVANMKERYSKIQILIDAQIPVYCYSSELNSNPDQKGSRYARMHHKFSIIDNIVVNGSSNLTKSGQKDNIENILIIRDQDTVKDFTAEFEYLKTMCTCNMLK
jgi:phosphatidylserine/phosphatidylglycerophosphate/cardiolipin synthase-like enzyme